VTLVIGKGIRVLAGVTASLLLIGTVLVTVLSSTEGESAFSYAPEGPSRKYGSPR